METSQAMVKVVVVKACMVVVKNSFLIVPSMHDLHPSCAVNLFDKLPQWLLIPFLGPSAVQFFDNEEAHAREIFKNPVIIRYFNGRLSLANYHVPKILESFGICSEFEEKLENESEFMFRTNQKFTNKLRKDSCNYSDVIYGSCEITIVSSSNYESVTVLLKQVDGSGPIVLKKIYGDFGKSMFSPSLRHFIKYLETIVVGGNKEPKNFSRHFIERRHLIKRLLLKGNFH